MSISENNNDIEVPEVKIQWTLGEKVTAKIISWGFMSSIMIIIIGGLWSLIDIFISYSGETNFFMFFLQLTTGVQILIIFAIFAGLFFLVIAFIMFVKKGYKYLLNLLFKIED
ncbi:MAG: hypothetical protein ACTSPY_16400 [Candidatus Helarchaeota archaeon]